MDGGEIPGDSRRGRKERVMTEEQAAQIIFILQGIWSQVWALLFIGAILVMLRLAEHD